MVQISIRHRNSSKQASTQSTKPAISIDFPARHPSKVSVDDVKHAIEAKFPKLELNRQRLTTDDNRVLADGHQTLSDFNVGENGVLYLKDLGRQVSWRTVFLVEYAGPLFIHPVFYIFGNQIYGALFKVIGEEMVPFEHSQLQRVALLLVLLHFVKRELETIFVHRFSNATMPFFNIFKNSAHYHLLSGVLLSFGLYGPWNSPAHLTRFSESSFSTLKASHAWIGFWAVVIMWAEASNLATHLNLRSLRPSDGSKKRSIPRGYGFDLVSCANYFFEALVWIGFTVMTGSICAGIFTAVSVGQMMVWASKKHRNYKREFGKEYPKRKAMIPYIF